MSVQAPFRNALLAAVLAASVAVGCAAVTQKPPDVAEVDDVQVTDCRLLGVVRETAAAGSLVGWAAARQMVLRVKQRAAAMGATHLVWRHRTDLSAVASVYRCPAPAGDSPAASAASP